MNDIEKAIKHFKNMHDENIAVLNTGFGDKPNEHNTLYANRKLYADLAIQALYEKQEREWIKFETDFAVEEKGKTMSKKYIDADELLNRISKLECESPNPKYAQAINDALQGYFPQIINDTPAADVAEVKHGTWILDDNQNMRYVTVYHCSECGQRHSMRTNFCYNCGAKMSQNNSD